MALFDKTNRKGGFMDEIRCDEPSYLIWKWHPSGVQSGVGVRENSIRWGSSLRVKDGEVAVFVYKQKDGTMQDFIVGPYDEIIKTNNFPVLASIVGLAYEGGTPFQAEVYFINLAHIFLNFFGCQTLVKSCTVNNNADIFMNGCTFFSAIHSQYSNASAFHTQQV